MLVKTAYMGLFYGRLLTWVYHFVCKDTLHGSIYGRLLTWVYHLLVKTAYMGLFYTEIYLVLKLKIFTGKNLIFFLFLLET